jgi:hypothetical protein
MILLGKDQVETMTSTERIECPHLALKSVHENNISEDFVDCSFMILEKTKLDGKQGRS